MSENNIDKFDYVVGKLFAMLYEAFPRRIAINYSDLNENDDLSFANDESFEFCVVAWLERAGFIWIYERDNLSAKAVLTPKGLEVLKAVPSSLSDNLNDNTIGVSLIKLLKESGREATKESIKKLVTIVLASGAHFGLSFVG